MSIEPLGVLSAGCQENFSGGKTDGPVELCLHCVQTLNGLGETLPSPMNKAKASLPAEIVGLLATDLILKLLQATPAQEKSFKVGQPKFRSRLKIYPLRK